MKISTNNPKPNIPIKNNVANDLPKGGSEQRDNIMASATGVDIRRKGALNSVIKENDPTSPLVSKKILDSLDIGFIDFSQKERDALSVIMNKAQ